MSTGCIDRRKDKKTPPHLNHSSKHTIGFQGVTSSEEGEPILLDRDPAKYWHDICTVPLGPYSRVLCRLVMRTWSECISLVFAHCSHCVAEPLLLLKSSCLIKGASLFKTNGTIQAFSMTLLAGSWLIP